MPTLIDRAKLRALAEAAKGPARITRQAVRNFRFVATPTAILALLDELEAKDAPAAAPHPAPLSAVYYDVKYGCHVDLCDGEEPDASVMDDGRINDCSLAETLHELGKDKRSCAEWQPIKIIAKVPS